MSVVQLQSRVRELEGLLHAKEAETLTQKHQSDQLTNDFLYNLKLLEQRDKELENADSSLEGLKLTLAAKEVLLTKSQQKMSELELAVAEASERNGKLEEMFKEELQTGQAQMQEERHKMREVVVQMQTAVREAQEKFTADLKAERQAASQEREALLLDCNRQLEETRKGDVAVAELKRHLDGKSRREEELSAEVHILRDRLEGADEEMTRLEAEHKKVAEDCQSNLKAKDQEIQALLGDLERIRGELCMAREEQSTNAASCAKKMEQLQDRCDRQATEAAKTASEQARLLAEKRSLKQRLKEIQETARQLENEKAGLQDALSHEVANSEEGKNALALATRQLGEMDSRALGAESKVEELQMELATCLKEVDVLKTKLRCSEDDCNRERKQRHAAQRQLSTKSAGEDSRAKEKAERVLQSLQKERLEAKKALEEADRRAKSAEREVTELKRQIEIAQSPTRPPSPRRDAQQEVASPGSKHKLEGCATIQRAFGGTDAARGTQGGRSSPVGGHPRHGPGETSSKTEMLLETTLSALQEFVDKLGDSRRRTQGKAGADKRSGQGWWRPGGLGQACGHGPGPGETSEGSSPQQQRRRGASAEERELARARKKLHRERKKFMERHSKPPPKDIVEAVDNEQRRDGARRDEMEFMLLRAEQLSEENGRLRYQLAGPCVSGQGPHMYGGTKGYRTRLHATRHVVDCCPVRSRSLQSTAIDDGADANSGGARTLCKPPRQCTGAVGGSRPREPSL
ncbi:unnamed protein product [Ostreobium quekettii]|uniref:Uncharacterized protein n=1 Tax=Ostreobium quekettii TaxID=121088 RepID=A0A8S1IPC0_9CHLO|nr:unnamed protein product [Ostreobium quekettii]